jgi:hypothetical protein
MSNMKERKPYQNIEEEDGSCMTASEPAVAVMSDVAPIKQNSFTIPEGMPQSVDEALSDIDEGEKEFERGETFTHREVMQMIWNKIACYAG